MDLEIMGFDGVLGSETITPAYLSSSSSPASASASIYPSDSEAKKRLHQGSGFLSPVSKATLLRSMSNGNYFSENGQNMLSFSPSNNDHLYQHHQTSPLSCGGSVNGSTMNRMMMMMMRGPFTQSQWMELENQALIYKYINANAPVPSNLLIPILKAASFSPFSVGGWGPFHVGFSNSSDPEPGRCRRTDGKKWRCSRDSVPDHKYCERHMNRGRHRSRKPVEGQTGRSVAVSSSTTAKMVQAAVATAAAADGLSLSQPGGSSNASPCSTNGNRVFLNTEKEKMIGKVEDSGLKPTQFGLVGGEVDSFLNNGSISSYNNNQIDEREYMMMMMMMKNKHNNNNNNNNNWLPAAGSWFDDSNNNDSVDHHHHEIERTELSISIPMMSDFIPISMNEEVEEELEEQFPSTEMGLGLGLGEQKQQQQSSWIPVEWGNNCMGGGPLGEVVLNKKKSRNNINNNDETITEYYALDLMSSSTTTTATTTSSSHNNWDNSPRGFGSSPTGVLHKVHFGSVSNSSAGSSPRTETHVG